MTISYTYASISTIWTIFCGATVLIILAILIHDAILWKRLPLGPPPLPLIGNKLQLPKSHPWIKFQQWSRTYGPMFTIWLGRRPTIVISDPIIASDLLEKRSIKYSSRPRFVTMGELYWDMANILVQPYGKEWSIRRKLLHSALTPRALETYKSIQQAEAGRLCHQLLHDPGNWEALFDRLTASIVFSIAYGHRIDDMRSPVIRQRLAFMHYVSGLNVPGAYLVESFPILKYLPDWVAPWKAEIKRRGRIEAQANMKLVDIVQRDIRSAKDSREGSQTRVFNSLTKQLLEIRDKDPQTFPLSNRDFSFIPASLFGAGSDTTASTLCSVMLALVTTPQAQQIAHLELDSVVGLDYLPTFDDIPNLPYLRALCKEVLRWRPVAVLGGTPHASSEDDYYKDYYIPKGTVILGNSWAINLNEQYYPSPNQFNPIRFLDVNPASLPYLLKEHTEQDKTVLSHPSKLGHSSFGWGRRVCPGAELATNTLLITLARLLWCFDIRPVPGRTYDSLDYTNGFNIRPRDLHIGMQVRSERHREVLERDREAGAEVLDSIPPFEEDMF